MTNALDRLQAHYKSLGRQSINVSDVMGESLEDGAEPLVFHWDALTPARRMEIDAKATSDEHPSAFAARVVAAMATDETGQRLFKPADEVHLRNTVSSHVLQEIAARMVARPQVDAKN